MKYLTIPEVKALLKEIPDWRTRLVVLTGFWHGLRASELVALKGANIKHGHVDVRRLKGSLHTVQRYQVHPDPELDESAGLARLSKMVKDDEPLLPSIRTRSGFLKLVKRAALRAGINPLKAKAHTLKHSCAMATIGAGIENTRQRLGHKSLSSTGAYLRVSDDAASDAIDALLGIHGAANEIDTLMGLGD